MKKLFTLAIVTMIAFSAAAQTQAVKLGPLGFLFGNYNLRYEKAISDKGAVQVGANYYDYELFDIGTTGFGIDADYRHYFKEAIKGFYAAPGVSYDFNSTGISLSNLDEKGKFSTAGIDATVGYQYISGSGFLIDFGLGYGYKFEVSKDDLLTEDNYGGGGVRFTFALGYGF